MVNNISLCCNHKSSDKKCRRVGDKKIFDLPRKYSRVDCITKEIKGFTMRSSCAPYEGCIKPKFGEFNVYFNRNPDDTISIKYKTLEDVKRTIRKLERLYKARKYSHQRIWQVGMIMYVRLRSLRKSKKAQYDLAYKYHRFLSERTKLKGDKRYNYKFEGVLY